MRKTFILLLTGVIISSAMFGAVPRKVLGPGRGAANFRVPFHQQSNISLSSDTIYVLTGWYFIDSTYKITIEPGTLIVGDSSGSGGTLIISRGAKIIADASPSKPIVFTSEKSPATRAPGDWGGVILLGNAVTNKPVTQQIEGGFGTIPNSTAMFGGADDNDSSGVLRYVRIEFGGTAYAVDNEINGLTLGGVGSKTLLDYIQVSYSNDDDIEYFGGAAQIKHVVSWRNLDDNMDTDFGFHGKGQFIFVKRDPLIFDASASSNSNGFESDNEGTSPFSSMPRTSAKFSNVTYVGPMSDTNATVSSKWDFVALIRRASEISIYNSILMGWPKGIQLKDTLTQRAAIDGRLQIRDVSLQSKQNPAITLSSSPSTGNIAGFDAVAWFNTAGWGNIGASARNTTDMGLQNHTPLNASIDPRPKPGTEAVTAGTGYAAWGLPAWYDSVSYRGAFDPAKSMDQQWTAGWTNFTPELTDYSGGNPLGVEANGFTSPAHFELGQNYPNPFNPSTTIRFSVPSSGMVTVKVFDILGKEVATLVNGTLAAGYHMVRFNASNLSSGIYFYSLTAGNFTQIKKMTLLK